MGLCRHENHLRSSCGPVVRGKQCVHVGRHLLLCVRARSYTSYGRHFTKREHMKKLCERLVPFLLPGDTVVDFSCGSNEFVPLLKRLCAEDGWVRRRSLSFPGALSHGPGC